MAQRKKSARPSSRRVRAKRSREGVPAFCMIPIIHSVQYIFAILDATNGASWYFVIEGGGLQDPYPYTHRGWWTPRSLPLHSSRVVDSKILTLSDPLHSHSPF